MPDIEETLLSIRTHPKVLFVPVVVQVLLIAAHVAAAMYLPRDTGIAVFDQWGPLALHGIIGILEFVYAVLPVLRWWNSTFTVTTHRVSSRWGVLYKQSREISMDRIVSVDMERGILDRIFGCGTLVFHDAATAGRVPARNVLTRQNGGVQPAGIRFQDVPHVKQVHELVDELRYGQSADD